MQSQHLRAAQAMLAGGGQSAPAAGPIQKGPMGQHGLLAMIAAREDGCDCRACNLLRKVVDELFTALLKQAGEPAPAAGVPIDGPTAAGPGEGADGGPG